MSTQKYFSMCFQSSFIYNTTREEMKRDQQKMDKQNLNIHIMEHYQALQRNKIFHGSQENLSD
jgi:hypothetical protein